MSNTHETRVLLISGDMVGPRMAGTGIRNWELAKVLSGNCQVVLATPLSGQPPAAPFEIYPLTLKEHEEINRALDQADVVISSISALQDYPQLAQLRVPWVGDVYVPTATESLPLHEHQDLATRLYDHAVDISLLDRFLARVDYVICSSERQRDFLLGMLAALGRLNPYVYDETRDMRAFVDVVPFGIPSEPPRRSQPVMRGILPGVGEGEHVLVWGGGIWNWFDPLTLVQAVADIVTHRPDVRLVFPGVRRPFEERIPEMRMCRLAMTLSDELGLTDRYVFFGDWVPYDERGAYLVEADIGISLNLDGIEPRYAFRTRILDYIWAGLPMIVTEGDVLADLVHERGLGHVVASKDLAEVTAAIESLLDERDPRGSRADSFKELRAQFAWEQVARPLVDLCQNPHLAADRRAGYKMELGPALDSQRLHELEELVAAYEQGRFIRTMAALKRWQSRVLGRGRKQK